MVGLSRISFIKTIFALACILLFVSFTHKDLNEYGKWLKFYGLKDEDFVSSGTEKQFVYEWKSHDLNNEEFQLYRNYFFYPNDSGFFLDLYSYNVIINKDANGIINWGAGDPDSKIQLVNSKTKDATALLFFGTVEYVETAIWRNDKKFELFGFTIEGKYHVPTIWKFDLKKMSYQCFKSNKRFHSPIKSYLRDVILKDIQEKK